MGNNRNGNVILENQIQFFESSDHIPEMNTETKKRIIKKSSGVLTIECKSPRNELFNANAFFV